MYPLKNLRRRSARTSLTIAGVSLAITLVIIMFSISEGIRDSTDKIIEKSGIDILVVPSGGNIFIGAGEFSYAREIAWEMEVDNENISGAFPVLRERVYVSTGETKEGEDMPVVTSMLAKGLSREANEAFETAEIIKGSELPTYGDPFYANGTYDGGADSENFTHELVVNSPLARQLELDLDDVVYISPQLPATSEDFAAWIANATWFRVVGIRTQSFEDEGAMAASLHLSELQYISGKSDRDWADIIVVDLHDPSKAGEVKQWLESDYSHADDISAFTQEDIRQEIEQYTAIYKGFSEMVAGVTLLVALLFTSTVIMISVKERTGELSALRAIGFSRASIFKLVLAEAVLICLIGFVIGLIFGSIGVEVVNGYAESVATGLPEGFKIAKITPSLLTRATASITIIGILVGLIPAFCASRVNIVEAMKSE